MEGGGIMLKSKIRVTNEKTAGNTTERTVYGVTGL